MLRARVIAFFTIFALRWRRFRDSRTRRDFSDPHSDKEWQRGMCQSHFGARPPSIEGEVLWKWLSQARSTIGQIEGYRVISQKCKFNAIGSNFAAAKIKPVPTRKWVLEPFSGIFPCLRGPRTLENRDLMKILEKWGEFLISNFF